MAEKIRRKKKAANRKRMGRREGKRMKRERRREGKSICFGYNNFLAIRSCVTNLISK